MFERWVFPSVFIDFTNEKSDSTDLFNFIDEVPGYINSSPAIQLNTFL